MTVWTSRVERKGDIDLIVNCKRSLLLVAVISNISVPGFYDDVMGSAGEEGSHGHHTVYAKNGPVPVLVGKCAKLLQLLARNPHRTAGYSAPQEYRDGHRE